MSATGSLSSRPVVTTSSGLRQFNPLQGMRPSLGRNIGFVATRRCCGMDENLRRRVMEFVAFEAGVNVEELGPATTLVGDLVFEGGLGLEFMASFSREFNVDMSEFDPDKHFAPDDGCLVPRFLRCMVCRRRRTPALEPISINDLVDAAAKGKWGEQSNRPL